MTMPRPRRTGLGADDAPAVLGLDDPVVTPLGVVSLLDLWAADRLRAVLWTHGEMKRYYLRAVCWGDGWQGWRVSRRVWETIVTEAGGEYDRYDKH